MVTNGVLSNLATANWFIVFLSHISPIRFICEAYVRRVTLQIPDYATESDGKIPISRELILTQFKYDLGDNHCIAALAIWLGFWISMSLVSINYQFRKV